MLNYRRDKLIQSFALAKSCPFAAHSTLAGMGPSLASLHLPPFQALDVSEASLPISRFQIHGLQFLIRLPSLLFIGQLHEEYERCDDEHTCCG